MLIGIDVAAKAFHNMTSQGMRMGGQMRKAGAAGAALVGLLLTVRAAGAGDASAPPLVHAPAVTAVAQPANAALTSLPVAPKPAPSPLAYAAPNPSASAGGSAAAPKADPATLAVLTPPRPPVNASAGGGPAANAVKPGMRLYLRDPMSRTTDPYNWVVRAWKSRHLLEVDYRGYPYKDYQAVFGRSHFGGPKEFEGDRRTPEGAYLIVSKHRSARFRWFMKINYPNANDQANYARMRADGDLPRGIGEGGSVGIHGTDEPVLNLGDVDWTTGCISVENSDITELERLLPIGTLVIIKP